MIEEHAGRASAHDLYRTYCLADNLLRDTQDAEDARRLRKCARIVISKLWGRELGDRAFSLKKEVLRYEASFIERALRQAQGSVTRAATLLGVGYQALAEILKSRHKNLLALRTPPVQRRKSIISRSPAKTSEPPSGKLPAKKLR